MRCLIFVILIVLFQLGGLFASPFLNPLGELSLYGEFKMYDTEHFWNERGEKRDAFNRFRSHHFKVHAGYGFNCYNTLFSTVEITKIEESLNGNTSGPSDIELGWRRLFRQEPAYVVLGEVTALIPSGDYKSALRYGRFGGEASLQYTHYFHLCKQYGFMGVRLGYRGYSSFPSDQVRSQLAVGWNFCNFVQLQAAGKLEYGLFNGHSRDDASNIAYNPNYRLFKTDLTAMVYLRESLYGIIGFTQHLWGRNVGAGAAYYAGVNGDF